MNNTIPDTNSNKSSHSSNTESINPLKFNGNSSYVITNHFPMYSFTCDECGITENSMNKFEIITDNDSYKREIDNYERIEKELENKLYEIRKKNKESIDIFNKKKDLAEIKVRKQNEKSIFKKKFTCDKSNYVAPVLRYPWKQPHVDRIVTYTIRNRLGNTIMNEIYRHLSEELIGVSMPNIDNYKYLVCSTCGHPKKYRHKFV